jgi:DNA-binding CsgD family transcriptional regulator/PAS domain-containing protein
MDFSDEAFLHFLDLVYSAAERPDRWREVYAQLQKALGVKSVHMLGFDKAAGMLTYSDGANLPVEGELAYMHHYRTMDFRLPMLGGSGEGRWLHFPESLEEQLVATHPLYQEFLIPYDRRYSSACNLVDTAEATVVFSVLSGEAEGPLSRDAREFLERLKPHLQRACRIGMRTFVYSSQALVGHLLVDRLRQPVFLMTATGDIIHVNAAARELLGSTQLVQVEQGKLHLPAPHLDVLMQRCRDLEQAAKTVGPGDADAFIDASQFRSLRIVDGAESAYAFYTMLSPQREMGAFGLRPIVMLLFYHPQSAPAIDASLLYAVFGLTPAESRIATMLAEGMSLKEIAVAQGTQHDTVRKQLRSIYQKTATNRQPELVRLLLHLPQTAVQDISGA